MEKISNNKMKKNRNILIIGNYGNHNIGDEILLKVVILDFLENKKNENIKILIPTRDPGFVNIYHEDISDSLNAFYVYDIKTLIKSLLISEKIIVGGGGIWSGYTGRLAKLIPIFLIISKILGKEIIIRSVGLYNTAPYIEKILVNLSFFFADKCSVRDIESLNNIWSFNKKIKIEKDLALELPSILEKYKLYEKYEKLLKTTPDYNTLKYIKSKNKYIVGISVKPLNDIEKTKEIIEKIANFINIINSSYENKIHFVFFPFAKTSNADLKRENDEIMANEIINRVSFKDNIIIISHSNPILWYLLMKWVDSFIGMRYHSILLAYMAHIPFVAIPYENKILNFIQEFEYENVLSLENFDEKYLIEFLKNNYVSEKNSNFAVETI